MILDTASSLIWIQCAPCNPCFLQDDPLFDPRHSSTYERMPCTNSLCSPPYRCINNQCSLDIEYDGAPVSTVSGDLAREMFHFFSSTSHVESIRKLGFGCVHTSKNYESHLGMSSGVLSLDNSFSSFARQLDVLNQFAYCLYRPGTHTGTSYLRFGTDIRSHVPAQTTPILHNPDSSLHFLDLVDLSIQTTRLNLDPETFSPKAAGKGGCTINTSWQDTSFPLAVWKRIERFFLKHFRKYYDIRPVGGPKALCFPMRPGIENHFASLTLHFRNGANLYLKPERIWETLSYHGQNIFCSTLKYHRTVTIIGFSQQIDTWFMFDLQRNQLTFAPADCSREG